MILLSVWPDRLGALCVPVLKSIHWRLAGFIMSAPLCLFVEPPGGALARLGVKKAVGFSCRSVSPNFPCYCCSTMTDKYYRLRDAVLHNMPEFIDDGAGALTWLAVFRDRWVSIFSPPFDCTVAHRRL